MLYLPNDIGKSLYPTNKSQHSGMHNKQYYETALEEAKTVLKNGKDNNWSATQYKNEIINIVNPMRKGLNDGSIKLNGAKSLLEKIKIKEKK